MSFTAEIGHYAGSTGLSDYSTQITQWLKDARNGVIARISALAPDMLVNFSTTSNVTNDSGLAITSLGKILFVERDSSESSTDLRAAKPVPVQFKNQISSNTSLYYAPAQEPKYYTSAGTLYVKPAPTTNQPATIHYVDIAGTINDTNETIANFPDEFKKHVVLWVAMNVLHAKMVAILDKLPTDLDADLTTFDAITDFGQTMASTVSTPGEFGVSTSLPALESMPAISGEVADALTNAKHFVDNAGAEGISSDVEDWLNAEDVEMVDSVLQTIATEIQRANTYLTQYQADQQKAMNTWRQEVEQYQTEIQEESAIRGQQLARYQAEVSRESARIQGELAEYQANVAKKFQSFNTRIQKEAQKYQWYQSQLAYVQQMYQECWAPYQGAISDQNTGFARARK